MITPDQIKSGQGPRLSFLSKADPKAFSETLVAFANAEGGIVVVGILEDGKPSSAKIDPDIIQKMLKNADELCSPPVVIDQWEEVQLTEVDEDDFEDDDFEDEEPTAFYKRDTATLFDVEASLKNALDTKDDETPTLATSDLAEDEEDALIRAALEKPEPKPAEAKPTFTVYAIRVPRSLELHSLSDGRMLIRSGTKNRPLGGQEIIRLASTKSTGEFEAELVPSATREDFSRRMIDEYLEKRAERTKRPYNGKIEDLLQEVGALNAEGKPTMMGIMMFTEYPQQWLPQSSVVFAKFVGTTPRGESGLAGYVRREELTGPLPRLIESAWNLIWSEMAVSAVVKGLEREEKTEYPQFAVREAIVNSVCHRDYRLRGRRIEIRMYSDRLEVISPGGLPGFITIENIKEEHFSRNPRLVNAMFQWGYIEELGLGIDRMMEVMEQAGHRPPYFDARPYSFAVTLYNAREKPRAPEWTRNTNHRQARALQYIREKGSITNREYRSLCQGISAETLRLDLVDMVEKGILIKVGSRKGTHYILK